MEGIDFHSFIFFAPPNALCKPSSKNVLFSSSKYESPLENVKLMGFDQYTSYILENEEQECEEILCINFLRSHQTVDLSYSVWSEINEGG